MNESLTKISSTLDTLKPFIEDLVRHEMDKVSALPTSQLRNNLARVGNLVSVAHSQNVAVDLKSLRALGTKLVDTDHGAPGFWPTTAKFISYRSVSTAPRLGP